MSPFECIYTCIDVLVLNGHVHICVCMYVSTYAIVPTWICYMHMYVYSLYTLHPVKDTHKVLKMRISCILCIHMLIYINVTLLHIQCMHLYILVWMLSGYTYGGNTCILDLYSWYLAPGQLMSSYHALYIGGPNDSGPARDFSWSLLDIKLLVCVHIPHSTLTSITTMESW